MWTARLRTDHVAIFRVSASKISNAVMAAAASGVTVVVEDLAGVIVLAVAVALEDSAVAIASVAVAAIALAVAPSVAEAALADSAAVAALAADGNNLGLECASNFQYNQKTQSTYKNI